MLDRASIEKEINDSKKRLGAVEKDVKQLRDWISANERTVGGMQETLRRITEEGILKARADLAQRENELQQLRTDLAQSEKVLAKINEIERKEQEIISLEREQERIIVLLEKHRTELRQIQAEYEDLTRPVVTALPPCELVLPNNTRIALDPAKGEYTIGWHDAGQQTPPDIDLHAAGGSTQGVSRRHALLRAAQGQWTLTDLGSTNGTYLDDVPLAPNAPTALQDKTKIRLGNLLLFFRYVTRTVRLQ